MNRNNIKSLIKYWRSIVVILAPVVSALIFIGSTSQKGRCAYVIAVTATYWITEALPLPVTSLIPVFAFPLMGILPSDKVCAAYMDETNMMFMGGLMVAIAVEHSNLHKRVALFTIMQVGHSPRRLMAGFMIATMFISMWISNTATTAMMIPIAYAILQELYSTNNPIGQNKMNDVYTIPERNNDKFLNNRENNHFGSKKLECGQDIQIFSTNNYKDSKLDTGVVDYLKSKVKDDLDKNYKNMYFLVASYASSIGGTGTLMGTGSNLVVKGTLESSFTEPSNLSFATWMAFNVPAMLISTILGCFWLQTRYLGIRTWIYIPKSSSEQHAKMKLIIQNKYKELGTLSFHELCVFILFILQVILWFFRQPEFMPGWANLLYDGFGRKMKIGDSIPAVLIVLLLFAIPARPNFGPFKNIYCGETDRKGASPGCLTWPIINEKLPWGVILLLGGGFALAKASTESGLSFWIGESLGGISAFPHSASVLIITIVAALITEITSNTAVASLLMPVLKDLSLSICVNPLLFMLPAGVACSFAFVLPAATPPNALVHAAADMKTSEMVKAGVVMKIICVIVINIMINTLGVAVFDIQRMPSWANSTTGNSYLNC